MGPSNQELMTLVEALTEFVSNNNELVQNKLNALSYRLDGLEKQLKRTQVDLKTSEIRQCARLANSRAKFHSRLEVVPDASGKAPHFYPSTAEDLYQLIDKQLIHLLTAYDLDINGTSLQRRQRLEAFLGLPSFST